MEISVEIRKRIHESISKIESAKDFFDLFKALNYPENVLFDASSKRKKETFEFRKEDNEKIKEIYSILSLEDKTHVFLLETTSLAPSFVRSASATFDRQYLNFLLIFTTDYSELLFVFPNREKIDGDKHKLKLIKLFINKNDIYYTDIQTISNLLYEEGTGRREMWKQWRSAFNVERVTKNFFKDYKDAFFLLKKDLLNQGVNKKDSHEFTLQLLNRIMFVYFISKKEGWLNTKKFVKWLWDSYKKQGKYGTNEFYEVWLSQIFFKAFNNQANFIVDLPNGIKREISNFPFLNGGLFTLNVLDELEVQITDELFEKIFQFYEKYNFTIREDMPLEEEVAVDPQMIGYVYESLANVAEEIYDRHDLGIFYTPRVEVDFMARRVVVEYLSKHLTDVPKENLYHLVFDPPEEKSKIVKIFDEKFWRKLEEVLDNLSAVDPACGSGAFLVGLLNVLAELYRLVFQCLDRKYTDFELKKRIIQYSLYGVDIMPWAIHAAELRLWLQLMVETTIKKEDLRKHPLLPNLDLNLRIGDSLVQEIGGLFFNLQTSDLEPKIKKKLSDLKIEKRNYFGNVQGAKFKSPEDIKKEELRLFEEIIDSRLKTIDKKTEKIANRIRKEKSIRDLNGKPKFDEKKVRDLEAKIEEYQISIKKLNELKDVLKEPEKKPFVWDIDFAEIFGDKNGFDIVIGNPPYVRQENIAPFNKLKSEVSENEKKEYKAKLIESVKNKFPVIEKIDGKSDYYIYFYFHGLSLLNKKGTFCFITSNSWLDVGYGKNLQEFLLKYVPIIAIYDNPIRSFSHADINTIIALFGAPKFYIKSIAGLNVIIEKDWSMLNHVAKFIMFKKPLEEVINSRNLIDIDNSNVIVRNENIIKLMNNMIQENDYRVFPIIQEDLLNDVWKHPQNYNINKGKFKKGKYSGNKWGGKFLRAPDIFYLVLKKGGEKLCTLGEIANVNFGIKTGINEFFYLPNKYFEIEKVDNFYKLIPKNYDLPNNIKIEEEFLKPVAKSPKDFEYPLIKASLLLDKILMCYKSKKELKQKEVLKYIEWGESKNFHQISSVKNRINWYSVPNLESPDIVYPLINNERLFVAYGENILYDANFTNIFLKQRNPDLIDIFININYWTFIMLCWELFGIANLGGGAIKQNPAYMKFVIIPNPEIFISSKEKMDGLRLKISNRKIKSIFEELGINPKKPIREQTIKPLEARDKLDKIIFDELGITEDQRKEVYWAICELVHNRLSKSKSLKKK